MRPSLLLLVALVACSSSSGPRQVPVLTTQLSSSVESVSGGVLTVTLTASNPTDTALHLSFTPGVIAEVKAAGQWEGGGVGLGDGFTNFDTLSLASGAVATLGSDSVTFAPSPSIEYFSLSPGTYDVRACYYPSAAGNRIVEPVCGNGVALTLTP